MVSIQELQDALAAALRGNVRSSLGKLAERYDDYILELDHVPDEAWNVLSTVFRESATLQQRGLEKFLLELNVDQEKYSPSQLQEFLKLLESGAAKMEHEIARHAAGDLIARIYPPELAFKTFQRLARNGARERHVALVGLDVLRNHADDVMVPAIEDLFRVLLDAD